MLQRSKRIKLSGVLIALAIGLVGFPAVQLVSRWLGIDWFNLFVIVVGAIYGTLAFRMADTVYRKHELDGLYWLNLSAVSNRPRAARICGAFGYCIAAYVILLAIGVLAASILDHWRIVKLLLISTAPFFLLMAVSRFAVAKYVERTC